MSSDPVIKTSNLGKFFPKKRSFNLFRSARGIAQAAGPEDGIWGVRGVDLTLARGETCGIVGVNGSGKSTFLQMVCGVLEPSEGEVVVGGRISGLLELGAGFSRDLTGRENVYLNGAISGFAKAEVEDRFDQIEAFAGIGRYIDEPVETYSSGMYARLAFSTVVSFDPDVLIVDEALAVGDEAFQRKCFARMEEIKQQGASILFVSHDPGSIVSLCDRALLFDGGEKLIEGDPKAIIGLYHRLIYSTPDQAMKERQRIRDAESAEVLAASLVADTTKRVLTRPTVTARYDPEMQSASMIEYPTKGAEIHSIALRTRDGEQVNILDPHESYELTYEVEFKRDVTNVRLGSMIRSKTGVELGGVATHPPGQGVPLIEAGSRLVVRLPLVPRLTPGAYFLNAGLVGTIDGEEGYLHRIVDALMIRVPVAATHLATGLVDFSSDIYEVSIEEMG